MNKRQRPWIRTGLYALCMLVLAALIFFSVRIVIRAVGSRENTGSPESQSSLSSASGAEVQSRTAPQTALGSTRAPYQLRTVQSQINGVSYTTFEVYNSLSKEQDLVFVCGRMFESASVQEIAWDGTEGYDIVVTLRDGEKVYYGFDEMDGWR